ncbi:MAG: RHS repeat-associated core domain-containing protein [Bacteroidota bacterium]|nr:RHS repeat-associated core domain-containing protein [Bacteroidota bacterium]
MHRNHPQIPIKNTQDNHSICSVNGKRYRYGFNGKEKDNETYGEGNAYDFGARIYDSRLGRFLSSDPKEMEYPWQSTFAYFKNCPISTIDFEGMGEKPSSGLKSNDETENDDKTAGDLLDQNNQKPPKTPLITRTKVKLVNAISINSGIRTNTSFSSSFRVKGKNAVQLTFFADGEPDQLEVYKVYFFVIRSRIINTGMMINNYQTRLKKGRYFVKVTPGTTSSRTTYLINIQGTLIKRKEVKYYKNRIGVRKKTKSITHTFKDFPDEEKSKQKSRYEPK